MMGYKKLTYLQQCYAQFYANEKGDRFMEMVEAVHTEAVKVLNQNEEYAKVAHAGAFANTEW